jgi:hypothetical protein
VLKVLEGAGLSERVACDVIILLCSVRLLLLGIPCAAQEARTQLKEELCYIHSM